MITDFACVWPTNVILSRDAKTWRREHPEVLIEIKSIFPDRVALLGKFSITVYQDGTRQIHKHRKLYVNE